MGIKETLIEMVVSDLSESEAKRKAGLAFTKGDKVKWGEWDTEVVGHREDGAVLIKDPQRKTRSPIPPMGAT